MKNFRVFLIPCVLMLGALLILPRSVRAEEQAVSSDDREEPDDDTADGNWNSKHSDRFALRRDCSDIQNKKEREACTAEKKARQISISQCRKLTDKDRLSECWEAFAKQKNDATYCSQVPSGVRRSECVRRVAKSKNNIAVCDRLDRAQDRERCYAGFVEGSDDAYICDQRIDDPRIKASCQKRLLKKQKEWERKERRSKGKSSRDSNRN